MEAELRTAFLSFCHRAPELASGYLESFRDRRHADETRISILQFRGTLAQAAPKQLVDFTIDTLIGDGERKERRHSRPRPDRPFEFIDLKFLPASPSQGPFLDLLLHSPEEGVRLVRRILIYAVQFYRGDKIDDHAIVVYFNEDVECPANSVPVDLRKTGMEGARDGQGEEAHTGADCEPAAAD
jgi:hypothetical protein